MLNQRAKAWMMIQPNLTALWGGASFPKAIASGQRRPDSMRFIDERYQNPKKKARQVSRRASVIRS
jgi:hypothetical protein